MLLRLTETFSAVVTGQEWLVLYYVISWQVSSVVCYRLTVTLLKLPSSEARTQKAVESCSCICCAVWGWLSVEINRVSQLAWRGLAWHSLGEETYLLSLSLELLMLFSPTHSQRQTGLVSITRSHSNVGCPTCLFMRHISFSPLKRCFAPFVHDE